MFLTYRLSFQKRSSTSKPVPTEAPCSMQIFFNKVSALEVKAQDTVESVKIDIQVSIVQCKCDLTKTAECQLIWQDSGISPIVAILLFRKSVLEISCNVAGQDRHPILPPATYLRGQAAAR